MRILHLLSGREKGGVLRVIAGVGSGFRELGTHVIVGVLSGSAELPAHVRTVRFHRKGPLDLRAAARLFKFILRERISIIHTHSVAGNLYGWLLKAFKSQLIHVIHVHGFFARILSDSGLPGWRQRMLLRATRCALRSADRVIAVSEGVREFLVDYGTDGRKIHVIQNGVDVSDLERQASLPCEIVLELLPSRRAVARPDPPSAGAGLVGVFGRLVPEKNYDMFLEVAHRVLQTAPTTFVIAGDGPERARLERAADGMGLLSHVRFTGWLRNPYPLLAAVDIVASTSTTEGFPVGLLEAIALGRPVVATAVGGVGEIVVHDWNGILAPSGDAAALAEGIARLLRDPALRRRFSANGKELAQTRFSHVAMRDRVEQVYLSALRDRQQNRAPESRT